MSFVRILAIIMALGGTAIVSGCDSDGPAERAGERIDKTVDDAGDKIEDACEDATGRDCD
jgi:hypothetical protein